MASRGTLHSQVSAGAGAAFQLQSVLLLALVHAKPMEDHQTTFSVLYPRHAHYGSLVANS